MKTFYSINISQDPKKLNRDGTVAEVFAYDLELERDDHSDVCIASIEPEIPQQWMPDEPRFTMFALNDDDIILSAIRRLEDFYPSSEFRYSWHIVVDSNQS